MTDDKKDERTHTPGLWQVAKGSMGMLSISTIRDSKSWFIADVRGRYVHITDSGPEVDDRVSEAEANAHLIAAAPELLRAARCLRAFVGVMCGQGPDAVIPETIRAPLGVEIKVGAIMRDAADAIAKAEGRSVGYRGKPGAEEPASSAQSEAQK